MATFFPSATVDAVNAYYTAHFREYAHHVTVDPQSAPILDALRQRGIRTAAITNTPAVLARQILEATQLKPEALVGGDDVPRGKPAPDMVYYACTILGVTPKEALVVGDSLYDREAAAAAGVSFAGVRGLHGDHTWRALADVIGIVDAANERHKAAGGR